MKGKSVALFSAAGYDGISTPLINTAKFLAANGYQVDIYLNHDDYLEKMGLALKRFSENNIHIYECKEIFYKYFIGARGFVRGIEHCLRNVLKYNNYAFCIGFDPGGLVRAARLASLWRIPYIYHSLEFYEENNSLKKLELYYASRALFVLTQDSQRRKKLAELLKISEEKILVSCNSPIGDILTMKKDFFRKKFSIPFEKKIVLFTGSIIDECYPREIIESVSKWPDEFVLVLHGWIPNESFKKLLKEKIKAQTNRVFLSTDVLPYEEKYDVFQSVDIGLVFFKPVSLNYKYAAGSAGKLYDFMRTGVPVIANNIPGMKELVCDNQIGEVIEKIDDINIMLQNIVSNYEMYRKEAFGVYKKYEFSISYREILTQIENTLEL